MAVRKTQQEIVLPENFMATVIKHISLLGKAKPSF